MSLPDSDAFASPPVKKRNPWRWLLFGFLSFLLLLILSPIIFYGVWTYRARAQLRAAIAAIPADEPLTTGELTEWYAKQGVGKPDITNIWLAALEPFGAEINEDEENDPLTWDDSEFPATDAPWNKEAAIASYLQQHRSALESLRTASRTGGSIRYPYEFNMGLADHFRFIDEFLQAARLLSLEAKYAAKMGDTNRAIDCIRTQIAIANSLSNDPNFVAMLVRCTTFEFVQRTARWLLDLDCLLDSQLQDLQLIVAETRIEGHLTTALFGERAGVYHASHLPSRAITSLNNDEGDERDFDINTSRDISRLGRVEDCELALQFYAQLISASRLRFYNARQLFIESEKEFKALTTKAMSNPLTRHRYLLTFIILPATFGVIDSYGGTLTETQVTLTLLAIKRYHLAHHKPPATIAELVPQFLQGIPEDPFTGKPLKYVVTDGKCTVYSVGPNEIDDGGQCEAETGQPLDIGASLSLRN